MLFKVEKVTNRIFRLIMPYVCCYLVVGDEQAVLIDCGWGYGDIKAVAQTLTNLPITLVLSHGHPDHNGSAVQFDDVYLNERDFNMIEAQSEIALRRQLMLKYVASDFVENLNLWQAPRTALYTPLTEDIQFHLGGLTILPYDLPGHSMGCMVFIIPEERIAIFGDAISHPTLMFLENSSTIQEHYEAMVKFSVHAQQYDRVLVNHETFELDKRVLDNNIRLAKAILDGTDEKIPASKRNQRFSGHTVLMARQREPWLPSEPHKIGNIYYRDDRIQ
ncbi:MBL fold metallo-hydrolase [Fundicoccus culcitae]|uniref:MBL fold metallo-hydrolase n=1 Tax=Fundicoccus culcitae TaxID=2969821 RepID=A0ABY5P8P5_9LACT|nr:MBL fold metallo-hydrolase [Fundicoccus culcitae]UUX34740.1 MBL fold metallo-hydrolase [Fundicoccus culcitae]